MFWLCWSIFRYEAFRWTHYPIRLNRKNRMVYVFRPDGTVLSTPWDDLFFTRYFNKNMSRWQLHAHVLESDKTTVKETIVFRNASGSEEGLLEIWEHMRSYMEEGPQRPFEYTNYCLPIGDRREPFWFGFLCFQMNITGWPIGQMLLAPIFFLFAIGRFIASHTSKLPVWPKEVEDSCVIEPNDPYVKDWHSNPPYLAR